MTIEPRDLVNRKVKSVACMHCGEQTTSPHLVSNFAGGIKNATELITCALHRHLYVDAAKLALSGAHVTDDGTFANVMADDDHFVKIEPVDVLSASLAYDVASAMVQYVDGNLG